MNLNPHTYPIHERFHAFQGEGMHMGRPAFFIRTFGCPVHCPFCDSAGTWHPDHVPASVSRMSVDELVDEAIQSNADFAVITGGEPCVHNLAPLVGGLQSAAGIDVHLETSGGFCIHGCLDWVTLSPKRWGPAVMVENVMLADEFKLIIEKPEDIQFYTDMLVELGLPGQANTPIWLHPEWSHREDPAVLDAIIEAVKLNTNHYRAGWQLHKLYKVDTLDKRSRPPVPLGGNASKGY